jgi:UDP-glucose 4-epimerase
MKKGTVLITGGAGYIGSHANRFLAEQGYDTIVVDNLTYGHRDLVRWGRFVRGDILDAEFLDELISANRIDAVMHFAALAYVGESVANPANYYRNNVSGTLNLMDAMHCHGVDKMIVSSTCATYSGGVKCPFAETHPQAPMSPYGRTKLIIEQALEDYAVAYGLKYVSLRYFNAAGASPDSLIGERHQPETHLIPLTLLSAFSPERAIKLFGVDYDTPDGTCIRDYVHVTDLARAHHLALEYLLDGGGSNVYNLGNGKGFSVREVINCVAAITGRQVRTVASDRRPGDASMLIAAWDKIRQELGWKPEYDSLDEIVRSAWEWHKKDWS